MTTVTSTSFSTSTSPATGITTINLVVNGKQITLRLFRDILSVDAAGGDTVINTKLPIYVPNPETVNSTIEVLGLPNHVRHQLTNSGLDRIYQIIGNKELFGSNPNSSRKGWIEIIDAALAKLGLFKEMNTEPPRVVSKI